MPVFNISGHMRLAPKLENNHHWRAGLGFTTDSRQGHPATENEAAIAPTARAARAVLFFVEGFFEDRLGALFLGAEEGATGGMSSTWEVVTGANIAHTRHADHDRARSRPERRSVSRIDAPAFFLR